MGAPVPTPSASPKPAPVARRWPLAAGVACATLVSLVVVGAVSSRPHTSDRHSNVVRNVVSGRATLRTTSTGVDQRWGTTPLTLTIDPTLASLTPNAKDAIMNAFGAWASSGAALPKISFDTSTTPGSAAQDGVNRLLYGPITEAGQEQDLALTISYTDPTTGEILEADTIFNSAYSWGSVGATAESWGATTGAAPYDLQNVATHEAGHFFGLGEDYTDTTTAMYYASSPAQITKRDLTPSDISVVSGLYSAPVASPDKAGCQARIAGGHGTDGGALAAFCVSAFVVSRRRRRA